MHRWFVLGIWYAAILYTSSLASRPLTNLPLSEMLIAKSGHVFEYGLLGWIIAGALTAPGAGLLLGRRAATIAAIVLGLALASLDETRQSFVYGRTATVTDVIIDVIALSGGVLLHHRLTGRIDRPADAEPLDEPDQQRPAEHQHQHVHR